MLEEDNAIVEDAGTETSGTETGAAKPKRRRRAFDRTSIGLAALIALSAAGIYYMHARTAKSVAVIKDATQNAASVETLLSGGRDGLTNLAKNIEQTRETIEGFSVDESAALAAAKPLERDPFEFRVVELAPLTPVAGNTNHASREEARAKALESARKLQLQSIMYGTSRRSCLVDGKLYFEGQTLGDFTIGRIASDAITIQSGEFRFELRLRK